MSLHLGNVAEVAGSDASEIHERLAIAALARPAEPLLLCRINTRGHTRGSPVTSGQAVGRRHSAKQISLIAALRTHPPVRSRSGWAPEASP